MKLNSQKGQGAPKNVHNHFEKNLYDKDFYHDEFECDESQTKTTFLEVFPKTILNQVKSKDIHFELSMNPYQGCEHGCAYCYARPTHEYWGYSAGIDFERKIMVKKNAAQLLEKTFQKKNYQARPIMLSGNTDCYQPIERKFQITRKILQVCLDYRHPVSVITKNALILRDLDILKALSERNLAHVAISIPTTDEKLRKFLEPRTSSVNNKLKTMETLVQNGIPTTAMIAPIIPGLNSDEILKNIKTVSELGVNSVGYTLVRLNDTVENVFTDWIYTHYPDRAQKVLNQIKSMHGGNLGEKSSQKRNVGQGNIAELIHNQFVIGKRKYLQSSSERKPLDIHQFNGSRSEQLSLF